MGGGRCLVTERGSLVGTVCVDCVCNGKSLEGKCWRRERTVGAWGMGAERWLRVQHNKGAKPLIKPTCPTSVQYQVFYLFQKGSAAAA